MCWQITARCRDACRRPTGQARRRRIVYAHTHAIRCRRGAWPQAEASLGGLAGLHLAVVKGKLAKGELLWRRQRRCNAGKIIGRSKNGTSGSAWIKALFGVRCPVRRIGGDVQRCCPVSPEVSSFRKNGCRRTCRFSSPAMSATPSWARVRLNSLVRMSSALSMPARPAAPAP